MPVFEFSCKECHTKFEQYKYIGNTKSITDHNTYKTSYFLDGKKVSKKEYEESCDTLNGIKCPVCYSAEVVRVFNVIPVCYDDNIPPGSGWATVDKRHQMGLDWDNPKGRMEARDANIQMKEQGRKDAIKMAQKDEEKIRKEYRQVSKAEAMDVLKNPNRRQEVTVINEGGTNT
jgi:hypothetical protein